MLELKNVSMTFNGGTINEKKALDDVSLNLAPGWSPTAFLWCQSP